MKYFILMALVLIFTPFVLAQTDVVTPGVNAVPGSNVPTSPGSPADTFELPLDSDEGPPSSATIIFPSINAAPIHVHRSVAEQKVSEQDASLEEQIRQRMDESDANFAKTVMVKALHGDITLSGSVGKATDKAHIEKIAKAQVGSGKVKDEIVVIP